MNPARRWRSIGMRGRRIRMPTLIGILAAVVAGCGLADLLPSPEPTLDPNPPAGWAWHDAPRDHRGAIGEMFDYVCPAGGGYGEVWGTDVYTDDSSVCTAAVHMGLLDRETGGQVRIVIRAGQDSYRGSIRNGIFTTEYGPWDGSFAVVATCRGEECVPSP